MFRPMMLLPLAVLAAPALAAAGPLVVSAKVMVEAKQRAPDGTTRIVLTPPGKVVPGDRVVFVLAYHNTGAQPVADVVLANPLPSGLAYVGAAQGSAAPEVSVDGKAWGTIGTVRSADGARVAAAGEITHIRWRIARPIAPGTGGSFAFQAAVR